MPKDKRKIYKCVKRVIDDKDCLVLKYKNLRPIDVRELRNEVNLLTTDFFIQEEPEYTNQATDASFTMSYPEKQVHFDKENCSSILKNGSKACKTTSR